MLRIHRLLLIAVLPFLLGTGPVIISQGPDCTGGTLPTVRNVGTVAADTAAVSPGLPASTAAGDLLLMFCETADQAITASGWTAVTGTPVSATGTRLTVLYKVAVGGDATTTSDSGNHQVCRIIGITTGTYCSSPFGTGTSNTQTSTTSVSISGVDTTLNNALVIHASAGDLPDADGVSEWGAATNASLGSLTEQIDNSTSAGTGGTGGGAVYAVTGTKVTAGTVSATTLTKANAAVLANAQITIQGGI